MSLPEIAYETFFHLAIEAVLVGLVVGTLFRLRNRFGLSLLAVFLGSNQYLSVLLASGVYFRGLGDAHISPGSAVFFSASLAAVLLVYLREDIPTTRTLIFGIVSVNVVITLLLWLTAWQMTRLETVNLIELPIELFLVNPEVFLVGTVLLLVDFFLIVLVYETIGRFAPRCPQTVAIVASLLLVLLFDAAAFSLVEFWGDPMLPHVLAGQVAGKSLAALVYGLMLGFYVGVFEPIAPRPLDSDTLNVFSILTYRERYEIVRQKLEEERAASQAKSRFLTHMSHELRTPLNAIIGFAGVLLNDTTEVSPEVRRTYLERVRNNGMHLLQLINGLLDLSKIESGTMDLEKKRFSLNKLVEETVAQLDNQALERDLALKTELPDHELVFEADPTKMRQILINLVGNAIKFTDHGEVTVRLVCSGDGRTARSLDVLDTGIGIPGDKLDEVFKAFSRVEPSENRRYPGTGLGLAISRALCEQMGLQLHASSSVGKGSHFSILFPQAI